MVVFIDMQHAGLNDAVAALGKHVAEKGEQIGLSILLLCFG